MSTLSTQILFIRHGETDWNRIKRIQGHVDIPLAASGVEQAAQLARRLWADAAAGARLDAVYSSDLTRARQTAQPFADALGLPVTLDAGLRERNFGAFQSLDATQIAERFPDEFAVWQTRDPGFTPPGGESYREFYHRVLHALAPIVAAHAGGRIACVAHGGVIDCVYRFAKRVPLDAPREWPLLNTSINVVSFEGDKANVDAWADVAHLSTPGEDDNLKKA